MGATSQHVKGAHGNTVPLPGCLPGGIPELLQSPMVGHAQVHGAYGMGRSLSIPSPERCFASLSMTHYATMQQP